MSAELCRGLSLLQHRGDASCGLIVGRGETFRACAGVGTVAEGLDEQSLAALGVGRIAAGYVRGGDTGSAFVAEHAALVLEGRLSNADKLREALDERGETCRTSEDAEAVCRFWLSLQDGGASAHEALAQTVRRLDGAFALVLLTADGLFAARDSHGACPLCVGGLPGGGYAFASESCALDGSGTPFLRDIAPGELVEAEDDGLHTLLPPSLRSRALCALEPLAAARADSVLDGIAVSSLRGRAGQSLAFVMRQGRRRGRAARAPADAALGYAQQTGIPFADVFVENRYAAGFFAACPTRPFSPVAAAVRGKRVVLVGDRAMRRPWRCCAHAARGRCISACMCRSARSPAGMAARRGRTAATAARIRSGICPRDRSTFWPTDSAPPVWSGRKGTSVCIARRFPASKKEMRQAGFRRSLFPAKG